MKKIKFNPTIIRYLLDVVLISFVWYGSMVAIKMCITLCLISSELLSMIARQNATRRGNASKVIAEYLEGKQK